MFDQSQFSRVVGCKVFGAGEERIGTVGQLYYDTETGRPEWVTVRTGLFGAKESFVPVADAELADDGLRVPYAKDQVKDAPRVEPADEHIAEDQEAELYGYYGLPYSREMSRSGLPSGTPGMATTGRSAKSASTDDAMTRSEERLRVGKESVETGRARLRKWVETEDVNLTVPVKKEKAKVETEPITEENVDEAMSGPDLRESEHEIVLTEERPTVQKETVPVERVRLTKEGKQTESGVNERVRKERIASEGEVER